MRFISRSNACMRSVLPGASIVALACGIATPAFAQSEAAVDNVKSDEITEIVVTGSRIARTGYDTPNPITAYDEVAIELRGYQNSIELFQSLPAIAPSRTNQLTNDIGRAQVNLRGLGPERTLLLVNGRRFASTNSTGGVDINVLPATLFKHVEIATGGASAAYGSDAVSGAISITLDNEFTGLRSEVQYGETAYGDGEAFTASVAAGTRFADGRGRIIVAGEFYDNEGVPEQGNRDWGDDNWGAIANPNFTSGGTQPRQLFLPNLTMSQMTNGGVITSAGPLQWTQFVGNGQTRPFVRGALAGTSFMVGGDGAVEAGRANVTPEVHRRTAFTRASFELTPEIEIYADGLYSESTGEYFIVTPFDNGTITIRRENAYLPASVRDVMTANNMQTFTMGRFNPEFGYLHPIGENEVLRLAAGAKGRFGTWSWDTYYQYSRNDQTSTVHNNRNRANWALALDAVVNPSTGSIVCRSTLTNPGNGCVPVNVFGENTMTPAALGYVRGTSVGEFRTTQDNVAFNISGQPFDGWAGPVSVATGVEYRRDELEGNSDPVSQVSGWQAGNPQPVEGSNTVMEGYAEVLLPLLSDQPLAQSLDLNAAARYTDYRTSGGVWTAKGGLDWAIVEDLRLRGTVSRDIRAPNLSELFVRGTSIQGAQYFDPFTNTTPAPRSVTSGNRNLKPEIAKSYTAGFVYQPSWIDGLSLSADYFDINIRDAIGTATAQDTIDRCFRGQAAYCANIIRNTSNVITEVRSPFMNQDELKTNGVDLAVSYTRPLGAGSLSFNALATYVEHLTTMTNGVAIDIAGQVVRTGTPHWKQTFTTNYSTGPLVVSAQVRLIEGGVYNATWIEGRDINDNSINGRGYLDLSGAYTIGDNVQLFAKVDNVFDKDPPIAPFTNGLNPQAAYSLHYDNIGRFVSAGVRVKL